MADVIIHSDEPTKEDMLNREQYAEAFARLAETCETPLVIGLYGGWGMGKTTLMQLIEQKLDCEKVRAVWFDPWRHQFDESPAISLLHTVVDKFKMGEEGKKLLTVIAGALGSILLKATTNLNLKDITKLGERYEEKRFMVREAQVRLQKHFKELIEKAQGKQKHRIVFFIDDLDRCTPYNTLSMLESLKLYLNLPGCVYFLGVDRNALEISIKHCYKDLEFDGISYLDKIVQLPFNIPPISSEMIENFIRPLLTEELKPCYDILMKGLGYNPRLVKRFINILAFNHQLALKSNIPEYDVKILTVLSLIQYFLPGLYNEIENNPFILSSLQVETGKEESTYIDYLEKYKPLIEILTEVNIYGNTPIERYIHLIKITSVTEKDGAIVTKPNLEEILSMHKQWLESWRNEGRQADLSGRNLFGANLAGGDLRNAKLAAADFRKAEMKNANLHKANLNEADLRGANLQDADLSDADLQMADLSEANLVGANMSYVTLINAKLIAAKLTNAELSHANLAGANLTRADLGDATLIYTYLDEADLRRASLTGANLAGAHLGGALLSKDQLATAITDERTTLPDHSKGPFKGD